MKISVVIPAFDAGATLPAVLDAAVPQVLASRGEIVVVESSGDTALRAAIAERWPVVDVLAMAERTLPGRARNLGVARTSGDVLVFLDADCTPRPGWLDALVAPFDDTPRINAVGGAIDNGTPGDVVGTASWLLEFSEWLPGATRRPGHAASANLAVRRSAFPAQGFDEALWPGEDTVLTRPIAEAGALAFAPTAVVRHANRTAVRELLRHQRRLGVAFARAAAIVHVPHGRFARFPLSVIAAPLRLLAVVTRSARHGGLRADLLRTFPLLVAGLIAWEAGVLGARPRASLRANQC
jgi:glycosyltransferase involved in cell wall biosynthesis